MNMISIARDSGLVAVISGFAREREQQESLVIAWRDAVAELGAIPDMVSAAHRSLDGSAS